MRSVVVGDIDGDGSEDVVACGRTESRIFVFLNRQGDGSEFELILLEQGEERDTCRDLRLRDLDGDGDLDVAFASQETNKLGTFPSEPTPFLCRPLSTPLSICSIRSHGCSK